VTDGRVAGEPGVERIFVYGTLRRGAMNPLARLLAKGTEFEGDARARARLYDAGRYPAAVLSDDEAEVVHGEVYRLRPDAAKALLDRLDEYEGYQPDAPRRSLFRREPVWVSLAAGGEVRAWIYVYSRGVDRLPRIESGRYSVRDPGGRA
jgi:gamma-glutamylcyclotransferase (GGCT)/AIG2-like uncharacterized protein YtfP